MTDDSGGDLSYTGDVGALDLKWFERTASAAALGGSRVLALAGRPLSACEVDALVCQRHEQSSRKGEQNHQQQQQQQKQQEHEEQEEEEEEEEWLVGWSVDWLIGWLDWLDWLVGWLVFLRRLRRRRRHRHHRPSSKGTLSGDDALRSRRRRVSSSSSKPVGWSVGWLVPTRELDL